MTCCRFYASWKDADYPLNTTECEHWTGEYCRIQKDVDCPKPWVKEKK